MDRKEFIMMKQIIINVTKNETEVSVIVNATNEDDTKTVIVDKTTNGKGEEFLKKLETVIFEYYD